MYLIKITAPTFLIITVPPGIDQQSSADHAGDAIATKPPGALELITGQDQTPNKAVFS